MVRRRFATKFSRTIEPSTMHGRQKFGMAFRMNLVKINISTCTKLLLSVRVMKLKAGRATPWGGALACVTRMLW
jgi:hypothetical protein